MTLVGSTPRFLLLGLVIRGLCQLLMATSTPVYALLSTNFNDGFPSLPNHLMWQVFCLITLDTAVAKLAIFSCMEPYDDDIDAP